MIPQKMMVFYERQRQQVKFDSIDYRKLINYNFAKQVGIKRRIIFVHFDERAIRIMFSAMN